MAIFHFLMSHDDFERTLKKTLSPNTLRNIQDKLETLRRRGLGDPPTESGSARNRRSGFGSRANSSSRYSASTT